MIVNKQTYLNMLKNNKLDMYEVSKIPTLPAKVRQSLKESASSILPAQLVNQSPKQRDHPSRLAFPITSSNGVYKGHHRSTSQTIYASDLGLTSTE